MKKAENSSVSLLFTRYHTVLEIIQGLLIQYLRCFQAMQVLTTAASSKQRTQRVCLIGAGFTSPGAEDAVLVQEPGLRRGTCGERHGGVQQTIGVGTAARREAASPPALGRSSPAILVGVTGRWLPSSKAYLLLLATTSSYLILPRQRKISNALVLA